jgi:hypothetical protein
MNRRARPLRANVFGPETGVHHWRKERGNAAGLNRLVDAIAAAPRSDYQRRRQALAEWVLPQHDWSQPTDRLRETINQETPGYPAQPRNAYRCGAGLGSGVSFDRLPGGLPSS